MVSRNFVTSIRIRNLILQQRAIPMMLHELVRGFPDTFEVADITKDGVPPPFDLLLLLANRLR